MDPLTITFRILLTFILALAFGIERQRAHKPVGFGTFTFVATGSCALAITAIVTAPTNPLPLLSAIVTGIGFLGAGALIKTTDKIFGFTTAAGVWVFAIVGLCIGMGEYEVGILLYAAIWLTIWFDWYLEHRGVGTYRRKLTIKANKMIEETEIRTTILKAGATDCKWIYGESDKKNNTTMATYLVEGKKDAIKNVPIILYEMEWFESCKIE
jgi:uncharacterized membrane protein YhiD involved in acid resistance